eukprot:358049-Prorocentrum_minimum.AAC.1
MSRSVFVFVAGAFYIYVKRELIGKFKFDGQCYPCIIKRRFIKRRKLSGGAFRIFAETSRKGWNQGLKGWNQGLKGWNQGLKGWNQGLKGWNQGLIKGWNQGLKGWNQGLKGWNQGLKGWNQGLNGRAEPHLTPPPFSSWRAPF